MHSLIGPTGAWSTADEREHFHDVGLAAELSAFFLGDVTVADFGCGSGSYVRQLRGAGVSIRGFDGNPNTPLFDPTCEVADLSRPVHLGSFDWVLSLEVGEHVPREFEGVFLDNLRRHGTRGVVLSWAVAGQPGSGHVNCLDNADVKRRMAALGYGSDEQAQTRLRGAASIPWFKNTLMVFRGLR
jgi:hypothetical protein